MKKYLPITSLLAGPLVLAVALMWFEPDLLWKVQQFNLFQCTPLYFSQQMVYTPCGAYPSYSLLYSGGYEPH